MTCKNCNHQNEESAVFCEKCGKRLKVEGRHIKPVNLAVLAVMAAVGLFLATKICIHDWADATCSAAKTCVKCGETEGDALSHTWVEADCTSAKTCSACGRVEGVPENHSWVPATCTSPMYCKKCYESIGAAAEHEWIGAVNKSGIEGRICVNCQKTEMLAYEWLPLTECEKIGASNEEAHFADIVVGDWNTRAGELPASIRFCVSGKDTYKKVHYCSYKLGGNFNYLSGLISFMEKSEKYATAKIQVYLDNELEFESDTISDLSADQSFTLDVHGVDIVRIVCSTQDEHTAYCALSASLF